MTSPDPVRSLESLATLIASRQRIYPDEVWIFVRLLVRVLHERRDFIDGLPPGDQELYFSALDAPLRAFQDSRSTDLQCLA